MSAVILTNACIQENAVGLLTMAKTAEPGSWAQALISFCPLGVFSIDFNGKGGILVNPESITTPTGKALYRALMRIGGKKRVMVGTWGVS